MSAGLFGLFDDIATLARMAAASVDDVGAAAGRASAKAAGVVVDDTAVTPQYVAGVAANRELPIIRKIAIGSLRNKIVFILPAALLLSQFLPWLLTPLLMLGGSYLCYEGAEKVWGALRGHGEHDAPDVLRGDGGVVDDHPGRLDSRATGRRADVVHRRRGQLGQRGDVVEQGEQPAAHRVIPGWAWARDRSWFVTGSGYRPRGGGVDAHDRPLPARHTGRSGG